MESLVYFIAIAIVGCATASPLDSSSRIANGSLATENQFPYAVSLQELSQAAQPTRGHRCGGALITFSHALTTATCVLVEVNGVFTPINAAQHRLFAGANLLTNDAIPERIRSIANFTSHPNYTGAPAFVHDIAIITVLTPFAATIVTPLALPSSSFFPTEAAHCQVAGWGGVNETITASTELRFGNKVIYDQDLCTFIYNSQPYTPNVRNTMVCAVSYDLRTSGCTHDEGNALVCDDTLTGILFMTDHCRMSSFPELYTRVSNYTEWIRSVSASPAIFTPGVFIMTALFSIAQVFLLK